MEDFKVSVLGPFRETERQRQAMDALARQAVIEARKDEMYRAPSGGGVDCLLCGRPWVGGGWTHGVGTKWGDACINTQAEA